MIAKNIQPGRLFTQAVLAITALCGLNPPLNAAPYLDFYSSYCSILEEKFDIKAAEAGVWARDSERVQAAVLPNPIFNAFIESIGDTSCDDGNEAFIGVTQLIELGGKRPARIGIACANRTAAEWSVELQKNNLYADLLNAFITTAAAQERLALSQGQQKLAEQTASSVSTKASNGKTSGIDEKKAQVSFKSVQLDCLKQQAQFNKAKRQLMAFWDNCPPCFDGVTFPLNALEPLPDHCLLAGQIDNTPQMALAQAESSIASNAATLERANAIPDVAFQIGVSTERFTRDAGLYVGVEVPIPIFNRNQGNIGRASYERIQAVYNQLDTRNKIETELAVVYEEWRSAYEQALILQKSILPAAEEAFQLALVSFEEGKFDYLNLLDARKTLFDIQQQYIDAIEEYHHKRAEVIRLTAGYLS